MILKRVNASGDSFNTSTMEGAVKTEINSSAKEVSSKSSKISFSKDISGKVHPFLNESNDDTKKDLECRFRLEVKDSGAGISPENQKKLFGQYVQFNAGKLQKGNGSGLGLWISKGIMELHNGVLGIHSNGEGSGSTFFIEIPLLLRNTNRKPAKSMWLPSMRFGGGSKENSRSIITTRRLSGAGKGFDRSVRHVTANNGKSFEAASSNSNRSSISETKTTQRRSSLLFTVANSLRRTSNHGTQVQRELNGKDDNAMNMTNEDVTAGDESPINTSDKTAFRSLQIYLVDDSGIGRSMLRRVLLTQGHRVSEAVNGIDLIRKMENILENNNNESTAKDSELRDASTTDITASLSTLYTGTKWDKSLFNIDVILIDDNMPEMSGPITTKVLRHRGYDGIIIGVTGNTSLEDIANFVNHGASHVYSKPLNNETIDKILKLC